MTIIFPCQRGGKAGKSEKEEERLQNERGRGTEAEMGTLSVGGNISLLTENPGADGKERSRPLGRPTRTLQHQPGPPRSHLGLVAGMRQAFHLICHNRLCGTCVFSFFKCFEWSLHTATHYMVTLRLT